MARLLGIDVGTSGVKVVLLNERGEVLKQASRSYPMATPRPGWAEQSPMEWWLATVACLGEIDEPSIDAIGVTGQMHGSVFLDEEGNVIRPALLWCDQRTGEEVEAFTEKVGEAKLREITGNPLLTGFQLPKVHWLAKNEPESFAKVGKILLPKDFIVWQLTDRFSTDVSDASGIGVVDLKARDYSPLLLEAAGLGRHLFPDVHESSAVVGKTVGGPTWRKGIPVVAGAGDQAAGAVGSGAIQPGMGTISLGSSGVAFAAVSEPVLDTTTTLHSFCHANENWHVMGVMLSCGAAIAWARDLLLPGASFDEFSELAAKSEIGSRGVTFLPYLSGERCPVVERRPFGTFAGMSVAHGASDLARAVFEGVSFGISDMVEEVEKHASFGRVRIIGGGAKSAFWSQMVSDVVGRPIHHLAAEEGPSYGAALLAGVGIGVWPSVEASCADSIREIGVTEPSGNEYTEALNRYRSLYPTLSAW